MPQYLATEHQPQNEGVKTFLKWFNKTGKDRVELSGTGWILAAQFVLGLKLAGPEFTQQGVIDALNTQTSVNGGEMMSPVDWTKQHGDPGEDPSAAPENLCANILEIVDGKMEPRYGEPGKPWICFPFGADELLEKPLAKSFAAKS